MGSCRGCGRRLNRYNPTDLCGPCGLSGRFPRPPVAESRRGRRRSVCGTTAGYQAHRRRGEDPCVDCRRANTDRVIAYQRRKKAKADAS